MCLVLFAMAIAYVIFVVRQQAKVTTTIMRVLVTLPHLGGQGVLIVGGFVLTAAEACQERYWLGVLHLQRVGDWCQTRLGCGGVVWTFGPFCECLMGRFFAGNTDDL